MKEKSKWQSCEKKKEKNDSRKAVIYIFKREDFFHTLLCLMHDTTQVPD